MARNGSGAGPSLCSKANLNLHDGGGGQSVHSVGMSESERSGASTHIADLMQDGSDITSHLDNLMGLNEGRGLLCGGAEQQEMLDQALM